MAAKTVKTPNAITRIDKLTPEQEARMPEWRDKWIKIGLSTEPADRPRFEAAVARCYRAAGLEAPKRIVWVPSPLVLAIAAPVASLILRLRKDKVDAVRGAVGVAVRGAVDVAVGGAVGGARSIRQAVADAISRSWYLIMGGQFWVGSAWWYGSPSFVSFFREVCGLTLGEEMDARAQAYAETAMSACWWWPHREFVMVCERPAVIARDDRGRLHREDGAAAEFRDGWGVYSWHGVRVPADVIEAPKTLTVARIEGERNAEIRRVMIERYGVAKYLLDSGAKELHRDARGILWRKDVPDDEPIVMVQVKNSTPEPDGSIKDYFLRVPPTVATASEAVAWTFDKAAPDYAPAQET